LFGAAMGALCIAVLRAYGGRVIFSLWAGAGPFFLVCFVLQAGGNNLLIIPDFWGINYLIAGAGALATLGAAAAFLTEGPRAPPRFAAELTLLLMPMLALPVACLLPVIVGGEAGRLLAGNVGLAFGRVVGLGLGSVLVGLLSVRSWAAVVKNL